MFDIDLVVAWVDGNDPEWQKDKQRVTGVKGDGSVIRFRDWELMKYWFRGVEKFLPWIHKVHFMTYGHMPKGIKTDHPKLNIVNHKDFIPKEHLPTFNSNAIEMNMFRIKDLSEHFIYANDDMFFIKPLPPEFFFKKGLPVDAAIQNVLQFHSDNMIFSIMKNDMICINRHFNKREVIKGNKGKWYNPVYGSDNLKNLYLEPFANFTGFVEPHLPYAYLKSVFTEVYEKNREAADGTISNRLRTSEDINHWLCRYWQFVTGRFTPGNAKRGRFLSIGPDDETIEKILKNGVVPMVCLSDDYEDIDFEKEKAFITECFEQLLPEKSTFEI